MFEGFVKLVIPVEFPSPHVVRIEPLPGLGRQSYDASPSKCSSNVVAGEQDPRLLAGLSRTPYMVKNANSCGGFHLFLTFSDIMP